MTESRETNTQVQMSTGEPAQSPIESVTEKKAKDPKVAAAGCAGAAARRKRKNDCSNSFRQPHLPVFLQRELTGNS